MILTDGDERLADLARSAGRGRACALDDLAPGDLALWGAAGGGAGPVHVIEGGSPSAFWSRLVLVAESPRSQFDRLLTDVGGGGGLAGPVACVALAGSGFHGHRGRPWSALEGNLHLSVALPAGTVPDDAGLALTMLPAVAALDATRVATGGRVRPDIKWVNDLLVDGRKVAGVLTTTQSTAGSLNLVVLGVGLNVAHAPAVAATPFVPAVDCLHAVPGGASASLPAVLWAILDALEARIRALREEGPGSLFDAYRASSLVVGRRVRVWEEGIDDGAAPSDWPSPMARGEVSELAADLSLRVAGRAEPVTRGRLAFEEACAAFGL